MFGDPDFNRKDVKIPSDLRDLITKMLDKNGKTRIKISEVKNHPYFKDFDFDKLLKKEIDVPDIASRKILKNNENKYNVKDKENVSENN